ncbi:pyruvate synthase subunit beta [Thermanaerosceptrum fracticalcis]|uniref:Pyruvate synthase subunit beta n=1 Tax=Thermanaerosceptrum fracticalcis TaxID=1712410 RepID=A0A7G6E370_THEFR|nr:thiamine pyrophosphate-dependent enzyme [Thermanaerosceptrum fracticalcis]QNB46524.1 pyruvate synthase subunit beta [Thermanaerosceptrum fracticalcis]
MVNVRNLPDQELFYGHKACQGCGAATAARLVLKITGERTFLAYPASCISTVSTIYLQMAFAVPSLTMAFPATGAVLSGMAAAVKAKKLENVTVLGIAGDGGTADIGLQALSGAVERGDKILYVCYDNEAYMNTGVQRSSLTPYGAWTTTTPIGENEDSFGKRKFKKNLFEIMMAHRIPYCATASVSYPVDFLNKIEKAKDTDGPSFIHVMAPCPTGWGFPSDRTIEIGRLAVETGLWYLAEYENNKVKMNLVPKTFKPVEEYLKKQKRFKHLTDEHIAIIEKHRDEEWATMGQRYGF